MNNKTKTKLQKKNKSNKVIEEIENFENAINSNNEHNIPLRTYGKFSLIEDLFIQFGDLSGITIEQQSCYSYDSMLITDELLPQWSLYKIYLYFEKKGNMIKMENRFNEWKKISGIKNNEDNNCNNQNNNGNII